jgi:putative esterase
MKQYAGTGYDRKYEAAASDWRDKQYDDYCAAQDEYDRQIQEKFEDLFNELEVYHTSYYDKLSENEWIELKDYFRDYEYNLETTFSDVIESYQEELIEKYNFMI